MYKNCREELLAVLRAFVIETGENEFSRAEALAAMRRTGSKYSDGTVSAYLTYRCSEGADNLYENYQ